MPSSQDPCAAFVADLGGQTLAADDLRLQALRAQWRPWEKLKDGPCLEGKAAEQAYAAHREEAGPWWLILGPLEEGACFLCSSPLPERPLINLLHKGCGAGIKRELCIVAGDLRWTYARSPLDWAGPYFAEKEEPQP